MARRDAQGRMSSYTSPFMPDFTFTADDVQANREGRLTPQQEQMVEAAYQWRKDGRSKTLRFFMWWIPGIIIIGFLVQALQTKEPFGGFLASQLPIVGFVLAALLALFSLVVLWDYWILRDIRWRRISRVEGMAQTAETEMSVRGYTYMQYELQLENGFLRGKHFRFANARSLAQFESGRRYRVYYIRFSPFPIALSAEVDG